MKKAEFLIAILSIIALGLNLLLFPGGGVLTVLTLLALSIVYLFFGIALFNDIKIREIFKKESYSKIAPFRLLGAVGAGLALSLTTIGIMFKFQSYAGADGNLAAGIIGLIAVAVVVVIRYSKNKSSYYRPIFVRVAIYGVIALILILSPKTFLIEFKYRNFPTYVDALKKSMAEPDNMELWYNVEAEREKMNEQRGRN